MFTNQIRDDTGLISFTHLRSLIDFTYTPPVQFPVLGSQPTPRGTISSS